MSVAGKGSFDYNKQSSAQKRSFFSSTHPQYDDFFSFLSFFHFSSSSIIDFSIFGERDHQDQQRTEKVEHSNFPLGFSLHVIGWNKDSRVLEVTMREKEEKLNEKGRESENVK